MQKPLFYALSLFVFLLIILGLLFTSPVPQDLQYHQFADQRTFFSIPHFCNVSSNITFFIFGLLGFIALTRKATLAILDNLKPVYMTFFTGIILVCFGSSYYHLAPTNATLVWDRLPMTIAFMSFFCLIVAEFLSEQIGKKLFLPLILVGILSVLYWYLTEVYFRGDLRFYGLVQFLPMLLIPLILFKGRSRFSHHHYYWWILLVYAAAKLLEHYDAEVYQWLGFISGHSLKHIASSLAPLFLYLGLIQRQARQST